MAAAGVRNEDVQIRSVGSRCYCGANLCFVGDVTNDGARNLTALALTAGRSSEDFESAAGDRHGGPCSNEPLPTAESNSSPASYHEGCAPSRLDICPFLILQIKAWVEDHLEDAVLAVARSRSQSNRCSAVDGG